MYTCTGSFPLVTMTPGMPAPDTENKYKKDIDREKQFKSSNKCQVVTLWLLGLISALLVAAVAHLEILNIDFLMFTDYPTKYSGDISLFKRHYPYVPIRTGNIVPQQNG